MVQEVNVELGHRMKGKKKRLHHKRTGKKKKPQNPKMMIICISISSSLKPRLTKLVLPLERKLSDG